MLISCLASPGCRGYVQYNLGSVFAASALHKQWYVHPSELHNKQNHLHRNSQAAGMPLSCAMHFLLRPRRISSGRRFGASHPPYRFKLHRQYTTTRTSRIWIKDNKRREMKTNCKTLPCRLAASVKYVFKVSDSRGGIRSNVLRETSCSYKERVTTN